MDLSSLFDEPIVEQTYVDRDYSGFGNDVWLVRTAREHAVVRVSAREGAGGPFWTGVERLFGIDSTDMTRFVAINDAVNNVGIMRAPRVLRTGTIDGRYAAVVELLPGHRVASFGDVSDVAAMSFGHMLALGHQRTFDFCGSPGGDRWPASEFHVRAADTIAWLAREFREDSEDDIAIASRHAGELRALASPDETALVLVDIGGSQDLWSDDGPTAVVDTEVFAYAPRELELIVLESDNGASFCASFRRGYESVSPLPDLTPYRDAYRVLIALMEVNGEIPLEAALAAPAWF